MYMRGSRKRDRYVYGTMNFPVQLCSIVFESEEGGGVQTLNIVKAI